jgi:hypothetical protein
MRPPIDAPVVALDIDGTLGDYHGHFTRFAEQWCGKPMPPPEENTGGVPFHKHLCISKSTYRQCKLAYRQGGLKRSMPVYEGAADLTRHIRKTGAQVWICTTRPYLRLDNIDPDTRHWLRRNRIQYDSVLFGEHKYRDLKQSVNGKVLLVADDLPEMIKQANKLGMETTLRRQPYNYYYWSSEPWQSSFGSMAQLQDIFDKEWSDGQKGT